MFGALSAFFTFIFLRVYKYEHIFWPCFISIILGQFLCIFEFYNAVLLTFVYAILVSMSFIDYSTGEIPHLLTIALFLIGITFGSINYGTHAFLTFGILFIGLFIMHFLTKGKGIGAGDLKIYMIFGLFFPIQYYLLFIIINTAFDFLYLILANFFKWEKTQIKYAPILSISFFATSLILGFLF